LKSGRAKLAAARSLPLALAHNRLNHGFAVFDHHVEVDFAVLVLFAEFGFGGADGFGQAFVGDVGLLGLLLRLLEARVEIAQARVVDAAAGGWWGSGLGRGSGAERFGTWSSDRWSGSGRDAGCERACWRGWGA
jgi:hypothetical protein